MWPDRVSNPGPPTYESDALPIALRGPAIRECAKLFWELNIQTLKVRGEGLVFYLLIKMYLSTKRKQCIKWYIGWCHNIYQRSFSADTLSDTPLRCVLNQNFNIPKSNISLFKNSLSHSGPIWNTVPSDIKKSPTINIFTMNVVEWIANE